MSTPNRYTVRGAELLCEWLRNGGGTRKDACALLGISPAQFEVRLRYIKQYLAGALVEPVAYDPSTHEYSWAADPDESGAYEAHRMGIALTQLVNLRTGTIAPAMAKFGKTAYPPRFVRMVDGAISELQDALGR